MVGLNKGKSLKKRAKGGEEGQPKEPLLAMSSLAIASKPSDDDVEDLPMSAAELGINLDDIKLSIDEQSGEEEEEEPSEPDDLLVGEELEGAEDEEPMDELDPEEGTEAAGSMREVEDSLPRLPFLLTERDGRDIILFSGSRILPTIRIKLKANAQGATAPADETVPGLEAAADAPSIAAPSPSSVVDFTSDKDLESLMGELGLPQSSLDLGGIGLEEDVPTYGIPPGAIVLLEGSEARSLSQVADRLADAFLAKSKNLTYISTQRDIKDVVESLFESPASASAAMKDMRLLVIPVYPLLRGQPGDRQALMDKLTGAPQLFDKSVIVLNCLSDMLDEKIDDLDALRIWPFLRKLSAGDKVVVMVASSRHKAVASMRKACSVHLKVSPSGKGVPAVEVAKAPEDKPDRLHLLKLQVNAAGALRVLR